MARRTTIQLDKPREIRFDGVAIMRLEELTGKNVVSFIRQFQVDEEGKTKEKADQERAEKFSIIALAQMVQAGVCGELPHADTREIVQLMDENGKGKSAFERILSYAEKVFSVLAESIGADEKNVKADPEIVAV